MLGPRSRSRSAVRGLQRAGAATALILACGAFSGLAASCATEPPSPSATSVPSPTATDSPLPTAAVTAVASPSPAPSATPSVSPTPTGEELAPAEGNGEPSSGLGLADSINELSWVRDGLEGRERNAAFLLDAIGNASPLVLDTILLGRPLWLPPRSGLDVSVLEILLSLTNVDEAMAAGAAEVAVVEPVTPELVETLQTVFDLAKKHRLYLLLNEIDSARAGVRRGEPDRVLLDAHHLHFRLRFPEQAQALQRVPWIVGGLEPSEEDAALLLMKVGIYDQDLLFDLVRRDWLKDGVSTQEAWVIFYLLDLARDVGTGPESIALKIADMPFLQVISSTDVSALRGITRLEGQGILDVLLQHPRIADGIDDREAIYIAMGAEGTAFSDPEKGEQILQVLLDDGERYFASRTVVLKHTEIVDLYAVVINGNTDSALDTLEVALREVDSRVAAPPSTAEILLVISDRHQLATGSSSGIITGRSGLQDNLEVMVHEVTHVYLHVAPLWLMEGAAEFMAAVIGDAIRSRQAREAGIPASEWPVLDLTEAHCEGISNFSEWDGGVQLVEPGESRSEELWPCAYTFGPAMYGALYEGLGEEWFWQGFSRLVRLVQEDDRRELSDRGRLCAGDRRALCYLTVAFVDTADPDAAGVAAEVIEWWYWGSPLETEG